MTVVGQSFGIPNHASVFVRAYLIPSMLQLVGYLGTCPHLGRPGQLLFLTVKKRVLAIDAVEILCHRHNITP